MSKISFSKFLKKLGFENWSIFLENFNCKVNWFGKRTKVFSRIIVVNENNLECLAV